MLALAVAAWALAAPAVASRGPVWAVSQSDPGFHTERPGVWDGDTLVAETGLNFQDAITWRRQHLPGPSGLDDAPLVRVEANLQGGGSPDPHLYAVVRDELGSVIGVLDQAPPAGAPALRARVLYTPYGEAHLETGPEPLRLWFDPTLTTAGGQTQQVAPPVPPATESGAIGGGLRLTTTARLDPASVAAGLGVERYDPASGSWVAVAASEVAAGPSASEESELDLVLLAGWPKGGQIRVTLRPALADGFGRAFQVPAGEDPAGVRVVVTVPASGGAPELDRRWPLRFDSGFAAANSLGGAFPDGQTSLYQGLWTDPVTGIAYARARWYDSRNATWLSEDPLGDVDSPNLYAFCSHNPHMRRDPLGLAGYVAGPDGMREQSASEFYQMLLRLGYKVEEAQRIAIEAGYGPEMGARGAQAAVRGGALASGVFVPMSHATAYAAQVPAAPLALAGPPGTALMGAWYGFTQKLTENALYNRPSLMQGVGSSTATGGAWGLALGALGKAGGAVARTPLAKRLIYRVAYSRVGYPILQATRRLLERETMPSILPMGRGPATAGHHTIPVYTGAREDQELVDLFVDTHFGTHEFLDNWSLPPGMSPRSPAPLSYRGEIWPWGRENPYLEIFAAESATNRRYIVDNLRRAYKEYGIYNELSEVFERESAIFIKGGE